MRNIQLTIEYDGTDYSGWQIQNKAISGPSHPTKKTIQETIEKSLKIILREDVRLISSGRTDAGVHALAQVANFKTCSSLAAHKIMVSLNGILPNDIVIKKSKEVPLNFHSRFDAKSKIYRYTILNRRYPSVFTDRYSWLLSYKLDFELMRKEARCLLGEHNFESFRSSGGKKGSSVRTIYSLTITRRNHLIVFSIRADGFLYNMVRNIVGTLVDVGRGKIDSIERVLNVHDRKSAGMRAPAKGLSLVKVYYK